MREDALPQGVTTYQSGNGHALPNHVPRQLSSLPQEMGLVSPPSLPCLSLPSLGLAFLSPASALPKANPDTCPAVPIPAPMPGPPQGVENLGGPFHCQQTQPRAGKEQLSREHGHWSSCAPPTTLILTDTHGMSPWHQEAGAEPALASPALPCQGGGSTWQGNSPVMVENRRVQDRKMRRGWSTAERGEPLPRPRDPAQLCQLRAGTTDRSSQYPSSAQVIS